MECLIGIGTGIIGKIGEYTVEPVGRQVGYLICYNKNIESLKSQVSNLECVRKSVERKVDEEKRNLREAEPHVNKWLKEVKQKTDNANDIMNEENKAKIKCLHGFCPNLVLRHRLSRKSTKLVLDLDALGKKEFTSFAFDITPQDVPTKHYETFGSRILVVNEIMNLLRNSLETNMIGVYGIGGVGKTTLAKEVAKQAADEKSLFDDVVMVLDVKKNPDIKRIQTEISERLGLKFPDNESTVAERARRLCSRIKDKKTLVILDDVWERIDLEAMGLVGVPNFKVLLTSRNREVLSRDMHTQKEFQLKVLNGDETWTLFKKTVGDVVEVPSIRNVATQVAERCRGLPVLVVTVASALRNNSKLYAWNNALRRLGKVEEGEQLTEKAYSALEWTYDQLNGAELKQLFLLCGFLAEHSNSVSIRDLLKYSIGLGLLKNIDTMAEAWDALNSLLDKLKDSCLLLDSNDEHCVRMHDLVHDVATLISSRDQHVLKADLEEWPNISENCIMISLRTSDSDIPKPPEILDCKDLKVLQLVRPGYRYNYSLISIPGSFFNQLKKLRVMDFCGLSIPSLPPSLEFLKSLKTLCLDWCTLEDISLVGKLKKLEILSFQNSKFKELPIEIGQLTCLRLLDLSNLSELEVISPGVISSLTRLEELRMRNSFNKWEAEGVNIMGERKNASLSELKHLSRLSVLQIHILDATILPTDIFSSSLERYQIYVGTSWSWWDADENLNTLKLELTAGHELEQAGVNMLVKKTEELHLYGTESGNNTVYKFHGEDFEQLKHLHVCNTEFTQIINHKGVTRNMTKLVVTELNGSRFLLSSSVATSLVKLTHLEVSRCPVMEEIISTNGSDEENMENIFPKLEYLELRDLPNLTSFCSRNYVEFLSLKTLQSESGNEIEEIDSKEHLDNVIEPFLFDKKLGFPSLKSLSLCGLNKLMRIWHKQNSPENFKSLESLFIYSCERLKSVFPSSMVTSLRLLKKLNVRKCGGLEVIVENEDGLQTTPKRFVFSKVESVAFEKLPQLGSFYPGMHISCWPSLKYLNVGPCNKVELFAQDFSSFQSKHESTNHFPVIKESLFLIDKDSFPMLNYLGVDGMEEFWDCSFPVKFLNKQENLQGVFHNLIELVVWNIDKSRFLLSSSMARSLVQLTRLSISKCSIMEGIVSKKEYDEDNMDNMFPKLQCLELSSLPNLTRFFSNENYNEIDEEGDSRENLENVVEHFLFDKKERFPLPNLTSLSIYYLKKLRGIWHNQLSPECLKNLETMSIHSCVSLKNVFSSSMARNLEQLREMTVKDCRVLEEIVSNEEGPQTVPPTFVFSKITEVVFEDLPQLRSFYPGKHISSWPSLKTLKVTGFDKVENFSQKFSNLFELTNQTSIKGTIFSMDKGVFHHLTKLVVKNIDKWRFLLSSSMARSLVQLTDLEVSECSIMEGIVSTNEDNMENMFPKLQCLELSSLPNLTKFSSNENYNEIDEEGDSRENLENVEEHFLFDKEARFPNLKSLTIRGLEKLRGICHNQLSPECLKNLEKIDIRYCESLINVFSSTMAGYLQQLREMRVRDCRVIEEIISNEEGPPPTFVFSEVTIVKLKVLPQLRSFYPGKHISSWPSLQTLEVSECNKVEILYQEFPSLLESTNQTPIKGTLFLINKLGFPSLKILVIDGLKKLMRIWHKQNSPENFKSLERIYIESCERLKSVFPSSMVTDLPLLTNLQVCNCGGLEVIVENEDGLQTTPKRFVFSKVESVMLENLPQLGSFYPGMHISCWPSLKSLQVMGPCNKVELFAQELSSFKSKHESTNHFPVIKGSLFLIDKDSFPKLNYLRVNGMEEFWDCSFPVKFLSKQENLQDVFHNLTNLVVWNIDKSRFLLSSSMARNLVQLTTLEVSECSIMEGIVSTKEYDEDNMENVFPKLQNLQLWHLPNLTRFSSNENYNEIDEEGDSRENLENVEEHFLFDKKARFPNLKLLSIGGLKKLRGICHNQLSPECLKNLETIYIYKCESLKNNFSSSMARNLQQLREMTVIDCGVLEEIVSNEEGPPPTFLFSKVTIVKLMVLPQLRSFYPGKHISSWPSLQTLEVSECNKVEIFSQEFLSFPESTNRTPIKGTLFLINKDSFHNLEELYIAGCHGLQHLITHSAAKSLKQLTKMRVRDCKGLVEIVGSNEGDHLGNEISFNKLKELVLTNLPRLRGFCSGNGIVKFPSLKTLSMSNRLKLIIFPVDETLQITYEESADTDIDSDSKIVIMGNSVEATAVDDYGALTLSTTSPDSSSSKIIAEDILPTSNFQTQKDRGVSTELILAKPLTSGSIHENVISPNDSFGDQGQENARLEEEPPKKRVQTNPSQSLAPNAVEACQTLDDIDAQNPDHQDLNPQILAKEVGQGILVVDTWEGNSKINTILEEQVQPTETNPRITREGELLDDVFTSALSSSKSGMRLADRLSALAAMRNKIKAILSAEDEVAKTVVLTVQEDPSKLQHDVQLQENLKAALQHLEDKKLCNPKKLSSAMTLLNLVPELSSNVTALQSRIDALQKEKEALQVERTNLNIIVAESESSYSSLIQKEAAVKEVYGEIERLQAKASAMASEINVLEGHIESSLVDPTAFEENAHKIDANNSIIDEVEIELVNIQATLHRHTSVVARLLKNLF